MSNYLETIYFRDEYSQKEYPQKLCNYIVEKYFEKHNGPNVHLGHGDVNFTSGFKALKEIDYNGNFTLETAMGTEPIESAKNHYLFAKNHISTLT